MFACLETRARSEGYMVKIFKTWCTKPSLVGSHRPQCSLQGFKRSRKFFKKNKKSDDASKKGKIGARKKFKRVKKDKIKLKCYNYGNKGHFTHSATKDHIARDRGAYVEFRKISSGEHEDGKVTELESRDATFLEEDFPCMGEIERDLHLYDMMDLGIISTPKQQLMPEPSRSELIEGEVHIVTQYDDAEPKSVQEALTCPTKDE
ncbi:hypothetical protein CK203_113172 [Vitis vinifera]|uniref:Uncharacterized protein n=1 Tax=Vitis vinifera TaxID=29760 RepID=A0A438FFF0_VITVI|nr:hypothetical protein CK203_113172 [Vitis vinifera]